MPAFSFGPDIGCPCSSAMRLPCRTRALNSTSARIDAVESDSFRVHHEPAGVVRRELWLWNWRRRALGQASPRAGGCSASLR